MTSYPTRYPGARWRPIPINHSPGMVLPPRGFIPHVQVGLNPLFGWFSNPTSAVSSHLWLGKNGDLEQYVSFDMKAWAQGSGNPYWISCECEGYDTEDYTPIQVQRLAEIYRWGMGVYGWPDHLTDSPAGQGLGTHRMGGPAWGGHSCPGDIRAGRRGDILAAALAHPTTAPPTEEDDVMTPEQEARLTKAIAAVPDAMNTLMTMLMRQAVTGDPPPPHGRRQGRLHAGGARPPAAPEQRRGPGAHRPPYPHHRDRGLLVGGLRRLVRDAGDDAPRDPPARRRRAARGHRPDGGREHPQPPRPARRRARRAARLHHHAGGDTVTTRPQPAAHHQGRRMLTIARA